MVIWLIGGLFIVVGLLMWHRLGDPVQDPEQVKLEREKHMRRERMSELNKAYLLAKEELSEEPTVEQIFLTRDQLRTQKELEERDGKA